MSSAAGEEANYEYVNGRLRARTRDFLPVQAVAELACADLKGVERSLLDTVYGPLYRREFMLTEMPLALKLENLISASARQRFSELKRWGKGSVRLLTSALSIQSDLENGQLFLRALRSGRNDYEPSMPGCGELSAEFWRQMARAGGDREQIDELCRYDPTVLSNVLSDAVKELDASGRLWEAEWLYMKGSFDWAASVLKRCRDSNGAAVSRCLGYLIDLWNLRVWLGFHYGSGMQDEAVHFLEGGSLPLERLLFAKSYKALLRGSFWRSRGAEPDERSLFELERQYLLWQMTLRREDPLGVQVIISYRARLFCEWRNLTTIVSGLQSGLDRAALQSVLFIGR
ncbi:V0D/AC39 family V-type ATPase subunit [Pyramidobacter piscolens]|uniref:V0D/AC39 family V-type ATPase subunit n=1 Tax=Pyramidobacter piscolens TaxID=638849 RepID=UPI002586A827|nr:V-type ATPase subunit [Pyramidobacter piscolens]